MTAAESIGSVLFGGVDEFLAHGGSRVGRKRVKHVDRDAQGRGAGDRRRDERDWSSELVVSPDRVLPPRVGQRRGRRRQADRASRYELAAGRCPRDRSRADRQHDAGGKQARPQHVAGSEVVGEREE